MEAKRATGGRPKNPYAVELGKLGGRLGGQARAAALSSERRVRIARQAAQKRWAKRGVEPARRAARGRPGRTEPESRVLTAATRLFANQGFHAVTMRDVAEEARVGLSTIYLSFAESAISTSNAACPSPPRTRASSTT